MLITNVAGRQWHSYDTLTRLRPDLIHVEVSGRADGGTGVDYTVNAGIGFPDGDRPGRARPPRSTTCCPRGTSRAVSTPRSSVVTALRHRDATGQGQRITIPLENVALATAGNLSFLTEVMVNGTSRERIGNSIYGQYGQEFTSSDGVSFMIVALTSRHFRDLTELTGTAKAVAALAETLGADFTDEGERYRHRDALTRTVRRVVLRASPPTRSPTRCRRRRSCGSATAPSPRSSPTTRVTANPMFTALDQPRIGEYLAPGLPVSINGDYPPAVARAGARRRHRRTCSPTGWD